MRAVLLVIILGACSSGAPKNAAPTRAEYAPAETCLGCHPDEAMRWQGSHHANAMAPATPTTVRGAPGGLDGQRIDREGEAFVFVDTDGTRHPIRYTFGVEPLQQYLVDGEGGRLQVIPLAWDTERRSWFRIPGDNLAWTGRYKTWNTMCADCHSTGVRKNYDATTDRFATTYTEVAVGCQACHGPGSRHAANPAEPLGARGDAESCGPCHARRSAIAVADPGDASMFDAHRPVTLRPGAYFPDGQILDEVFEYGSFAQSAMHQAGVRCTDCHDPHDGRGNPSNATCTRCHGASSPPQFPGLAQRATNVDTPAHHHHAPGSPGAQCVACHMPERVYMGVDRRHDHRFGVPRPDLSVALGVPDACTSACHRDRDATWSAALVASWFPHEPKPTSAHVFARAAAGKVDPEDLARIVRDPTAPAITQASALELLHATPAVCAEALHHPSPLVRSAAVACMEAVVAAERPRVLVPALRDPVRLVRIEAARLLAGVPLAPADRDAYAAARTELDAALEYDLDRPEAWFDLALLAEAERRMTDAATLYKKALALDPEFLPARVNMSTLQP